MQKTEEARKSSPIPGLPAREPRCPRCGTRQLAESSSLCPGCGIDPSTEDARKGLVIPASRQREFLRGVSYLPRGAWKALTTPRLWPIVAAALVLNIVFVLCVSEVVIPALENWLWYTTGPEALTRWNVASKAIRSVVTLLGWLVRTAGYFAIPGLTAWVLSTPPFRVIFAALSTHISEQIERDRLHESAPLTPFDVFRLHKSMGAAILSSIVLMLLEAGLYVLLIPIAMIPLVGTFVWLVLPRAIFAGLDQIDPTVCRKIYSPDEKVALYWKNRWRILGLGCTFFFVLGTPGLNSFVFPAGAAGAALLYFELDRK